MGIFTKMDGKDKVILGVGIVCLLIFFDMCSHKSDPKNFSEIRYEDSIAAVKKDPTLLNTETKPDIQTWEYNEDVNVMTDAKDSYATLYANDLLYFSPPYDGGVSVYLMLRRRDGKTDIMLRISKGQFLPSSLGAKTIRVRFDDLKPERYSYTEPSDGSFDAIFIYNESKFISKLKHAKKTIIECVFYDEGTRTITFNSDSLRWKY